MYHPTGWTGSAFLPSSGSGTQTHSGRAYCADRDDPALLRSGQSRIEATGGQEWVLWTELSAAGIAAVQLPPAQIKAFALSRGTRAKTDRIDAELIARFMAFRPEAGRELPDGNRRIFRTLTTR